MPSGPQEPVAEGIAADSVTRNAAFAIGARMCSAAVTAGIMLFLGRKLGPTDYGYFALAVSISAVAGFVADLGISAATPRFLAERRGSRRAVAAVLADALKLKLYVSVPVAVGLFALADPLATAFDSPPAAWPIRGISIAVFAQGMFLFLTGSFEALGRIAFNLRIVVAESVVEGTAIVSLVLLGGGAAGAAFGKATGYCVGTVIALAFIWRVVGRPGRDDAGAGGIGPRDIAAYAGALLIIDGFFRLFSQVNTLMIAAILGGGRAVGLYELPMQLAWFLHYPAGAASSAVAPRLARQPDHAPEVETFARALRYIVALQGIFLAPIVIWGGPIMTTLLGSEFDESGEVLRLLAPFVLLSGPAMLVSVGVNYMGEARRRIPLVILMLVANVAVSAVLLPEIGIKGAAIGTDVAYAIWVPSHLWIIHRLLGLDLRPQVMVFVRAVAAAALACVPLVLLGSDPSIPVLAIGGLLAAAVYMVGLRITGEISTDDIEFLRGLLARRFEWARR